MDALRQEVLDETNRHIETLKRCLDKILKGEVSIKNLEAYILMVKDSNTNFTTMEEDGIL